jgi:hypothetical protein
MAKQPQQREEGSAVTAPPVHGTTGKMTVTQTTEEATFDPYFQSHLDDTTQVIWATRPIVLTQATTTGPPSGAHPTSLLTRSPDDGVVYVASDRDLVVYADQLTVRGTLRFVKSATANDSAGPNGCQVTIMARELLTDGTAILDVSGGQGPSPAPPGKDWGISRPTPGTAGSDQVPSKFQADVIKLSSGDYSWWLNNQQHAWEGQRFGDPAGTGESSNLPGSDQHDPNSPLNGQPGAAGGPGGRGGAVSLRLSHLDTNAALTVRANGGVGGDGRKGQMGGTGGPGGKGHDPIDASISDGSWSGSCTITPMYPGGRGGRGGKGGKGGAAGKGGDGGQIHVCVRSGSADSIDASAPNVTAGPWGAPGAGGDHGDNGGCGFNPPYWRRDPNFAGTPTWETLRADPIESPTTPEGGDPGDDPKKAALQPADGTSKIAPNCSAPVLLGTDASQTDPLPYPLSGYLLMLVEQLRTDLLMAPYQPPSPEMSDRVAWLTDLLAYQAVDPGEVDILDAIRGQAQILGKCVKHKLDYFGHNKVFAPLGSMNLFQAAFNRLVDTFNGLQTDYDTLVKQIQSQRTTQLTKAQIKFQSQASDFKQKENTEEKYFTKLGERITGNDASELAAAKERFKKYETELADAISGACGLNFEDFVTALGQFSFFGEHGPQQAAMAVSQAVGLLDTGLTKCIGLDGTKYSKDLLLHQLAEVTNLQDAWTEYSTKGTIGGIKLTDPGGLQLLIGRQSELDTLCDKIWNLKTDEDKKPPAQGLKEAFNDFVSAAQQQNADILAYNESVTRWQQASASAAHANAAATHTAAELANKDRPGLSSTASQMAHMVMRAKDDCISELYLACRAYWMWSLQPGDPLGKILTDFSVGEPLALSPDVLKTASDQVYVSTATEIAARLSNRGNWKPPNVPGSKEPGVLVCFSKATHHHQLIQDLRTNRQATFYLEPARKKDDSANPFNGLGDVRIWKVRPWVVGAKVRAPKVGGAKTKHLLRVDLTHGGRERIVDPHTDHVHVIHHEPVHIHFQYDLSKPVGSGEAVTMESLSCQDADGVAQNVDAALVGPFTKWEVDIRKYNDPNLDTSGISELRVEFFCFVRPF